MLDVSVLRWLVVILLQGLLELKSGDLSSHECLLQLGSVRLGLDWLLSLLEAAWLLLMHMLLLINN
jgi:hypothetical protein